MKKNVSMFIAMVVILTMAAGLFGCTTPTAAPTAKPATQATTAPAAAEKVELRMAWWGSQARHDLTIKVIDLFMAKYPNIKITYEFVGWADYWTKMTTQAAGGQTPDIMQQDYAYINEWTTKKFLQPLDPFIADGTIKLSDVAPASLEGGKVDGKLYGLNLGNNSQCIVLDLDAFKKAGFELPKMDWTIADLEKLATDMTPKLGYPAVSYGFYNDQYFKNVFVSRGENFYDPSGTKLGFTDGKPLVDYLNVLLRMQKAKTMISREEDVANKYTVELDPITKSKAAIAYTNSNQLIAIWKSAGLDRNLKLHPLPRFGDKPTNYYKPSMFFSIAANSKHPKEAAMFIDFFTNDLAANEILMAERGVPISAKVRDGLKPKLDKAGAEMFDYIARLEKYVSPIPAPDPAGHPDIVNNVWLAQVVDPVFYGQTTPEKAIQLLMTEANAILAKNKK